MILRQSIHEPVTATNRACRLCVWPSLARFKIYVHDQ